MCHNCGYTMWSQLYKTFMDNMEKIISKALGAHTSFPWKRYIDDIYMIGIHVLDNLHECHFHMNKIHHLIQFKMEFSTQEIQFINTVTFFHNLVEKNVCHYTNAYRCLLYVTCTIISLIKQ